jgi:hypothetical protein
MSNKISELDCDYDSRDDLSYTEECTESATDTEDTIASSILQSLWNGEDGMAVLQIDTQSIKLTQKILKSLKKLHRRMDNLERDVTSSASALKPDKKRKRPSKGSYTKLSHICLSFIPVCKQRETRRFHKDLRKQYVTYFKVKNYLSWNWKVCRFKYSMVV